MVEALQRLAVLVDGLLHLVALDSLEGAPLPGVKVPLPPPLSPLRLEHVHSAEVLTR